MKNNRLSKTIATFVIMIVCATLLISCDSSKVAFKNEVYTVQEKQSITIDLELGKKVVTSDIKFTVSDESIGTFDGTKFNALTAGETTIKMVYGKTEATVKVVVTETPYEPFSFEKATYTTNVGETLKVNLNLDNRINKDNINYSSSNTSVATFTNGELIAKGVGETTITIKYPQKALEATAQVVVQEELYKEFSFKETSYELEPGTEVTPEYNLDARIKVSDLEYVSADSEIVTFVNGKISAKKSGETTITIKYPAQNLTASAIVKVKLTAAEQARYDEAVAFDTKVKALGTVTVDNALEAKRLVAQYDSMPENIKEFVTTADIVAKLTGMADAVYIIAEIDKLPEELTIANKKAVQMTRVAYWNASTEAKAMVTNLNDLEAKEALLEELFYNISNDKVTIIKDFADVVWVGGSIELRKSTAKDESFDKVVWTSSDNSIATVADGKVTGVKEGRVVITATIDGTTLSDSMEFVVFNANIASDPVKKFLAAAYNPTVYVKETVPIGAGNPAYSLDIVGSLLQILVDDPLDIIEQIAPIGNAARPGTKTNMEFVTVHYTGSMGHTATAKAMADMFTAKTNDTSIHYVTGNDGVYHCMPDDEVAYHAGDGTGTKFEWTDTGIKAEGKDAPKFSVSIDGHFVINGQKTDMLIPRTGYRSNGSYAEIMPWGNNSLTNLGPTWKIGENGNYYMGTTWACFTQVYAGKICSRGGNNNSIGIESCVNVGTDLWLTWQRTAQLVGKLMIENNFDINRIKMHNTFSGKNCPQPMLEDNGEIWHEFVKLVQFENLKLSTFSDYNFAITNCSYANVASTGRIQAMEEKAVTINYTVNITNAKTGYNESMTFTSILPANAE